VDENGALQGFQQQDPRSCGFLKGVKETQSLFQIPDTASKDLLTLAFSSKRRENLLRPERARVGVRILQWILHELPARI
jgi:hypothetical protein